VSVPPSYKLGGLNPMLPEGPNLHEAFLALGKKFLKVIPKSKEVKNLYAEGLSKKGP